MQPIQIVILGAAALIAVFIVILGIISARSDSDIIEQRLDTALDQGIDFSGLETEDNEDDGFDLGRTRAFASLDNVLSERGFGKSWKQKLARADLKLTVAEFVAVNIASVLGFFTVAYLILFRGDIIFSIIAAFIGFLAPRIYVGRTISRRLIKFENQLPDTLGLWVNALRSGYSVLQAMEAVATDSPEPTMTEFRRVVQEVQLGIDLPDAFDHMLERVESEDLDLVVTAVNIQREVGGNLAEILDTISTTIRERIKLKGEIRVLTAQGRITGYLISFLPIGLAFLLNVINPGYMSEMFDDRTCGWPIIGAGLALIGIGTAIIQKIIDIDI